MPVLFAPDRFAHANLYVSDMARSLAFYRDVCGLNEVYREPEINAGFLSNGSSHHDIAVMQVSNRAAVGRDGKVQNMMARGRVPGLNHLAFHMKSETRMVEAYRRAREGGVAIERALDHGMSHSVYLLDPDLNGVEFYTDVVANWRGFYKSKDHALISARWDPLAASPLPDAAEAPPPVFDHVASAPLHPREIRGAALAVADLARALAFYGDVAGLGVRAHDRAEDVALLSVPGAKEACLALVATRGGEAAGLKALWFSLEPTSPALTDGGPDGLVRETDRGSLARLGLCDPDGMALLFFTGDLPKTPARGAVLMAA
ncbi:MAG: VOC family protein [Alphaproteobacteria bacterium]